jgi:hypothetical protein
MGLFDLIGSLQSLAEDPELNKTAASMGQALQTMPMHLKDIVSLLARMDATLDRMERLSVETNTRLTEISLGLDTLGDPIKRPPFRADDVEAAMRDAWPPSNVKEWRGDPSKGPIDYTNRTVYEGNPDGDGAS